MRSGKEDLRTLVAGLSLPVCAELTPFEVLEAQNDPGYVRLLFEPQPAFENHFGNVQGGFCVAMLDVLFSIAVYLGTGRFLPTIELATNFLAPVPIDAIEGAGTVLRTGTTMVFAEASLYGPSGELAAHATGTALVRTSKEPNPEKQAEA
jgi:uncharacterized protein (TIGR00369 family)